MSNNKETLEQAAERYGKGYYSKDKPANTYTFHVGFKTGAQYEQSRIVALLEEELFNIDPQTDSTEEVTLKLTENQKYKQRIEKLLYNILHT